MQSLFIGLGAVVASALPWLLTNALHVGQGNAGPHSIAYPVRLSFHFGGAAFLIVVLWTVITTKEYPPENMEEFRASQRKHTGIAATFRDIARAWSEMPTNMARLGIVQPMTFMAYSACGSTSGWLSRTIFSVPRAQTRPRSEKV
jgi:maltose/moltooligosaccharide transporter